MTCKWLLSFVLLALVSSWTRAQTSQGIIEGEVHDSSGASIPGVELRVTNVATNETRTTITDERGNYRIVRLRAGSYNVQVSLAGFKTQVRSGINVRTDEVARVDMVLEVGELTERVEVVADAPLLQADSSSIGQVIDQRTVIELPLNGRNFQTLNLLTPGVQPITQTSNLRGRGEAVNISGMRDSANNYVLDGASLNDYTQSQLLMSPSIDAIQEFKVHTSNYSAEFGNALGGVITLVTKSGSNNFRGSLFHFLRNSALDAKNFFDRGGEKIPPFQRNQFGGSFGGPILTDRMFFFGNYEGLQERKGATITARVPSDRERTGDLSRTTSTPIRDPLTRQAFPGNVIPQNRINPVARSLMELGYPRENNPSDPRRNLVSNPKLKDKSDQVNTRVDYRLSDKDNLFTRYSYRRTLREDPFRRNISPFPGFEERFNFWSHNAVANWTHIFNPNLVNEFSSSFSRMRNARVGPRAGTNNNIAQQVGLANVRSTVTFDNRGFGFPVTNITGFEKIQDSAFGFQYKYYLYQWIDNLSWTVGKHNFKTGADIRRAVLNLARAADGRENGILTFTGVFSGNAFGDFLLGFPLRTERDLGEVDIFPRFTLVGTYFQDDWKVSSRLTFNLGARYEFQTPGGDRDAKTKPILSNFRFDPPFNGRPVVVGAEGTPTSAVDNDYNNVAPRIGFAYDLLGNKKTFVRGGYGISYGLRVFSTIVVALQQSYPFVIPEQFNNDPARPTEARILSNAFPPPSQVSAPGTIRTPGIDPKLRTEYSQQWSLNLQHEVLPDLLIDLGYVGSKGTKLEHIRELNLARPGTGSIRSRRPYPDWGNVPWRDSSGASTFHSGQLRIEKRMSHGLSLISSYTWSKTIDNGQGGDNANQATQDEGNLRAQKGLTVWDARHRFSLGYIYNIPFPETNPALDALLSGWQISGITTLQSGNPITVTIPGDPLQRGISNTIRPNLIGPAELPSKQRDPSKWFNTAAFQQPAPLEFGNAGRGIVEGPGINNFDLSLSKTFPVREDTKVIFRGEFFNLFNHPNFERPNVSFGTAQFGTVPSARDSRQIQFGLRLEF